MEQLRARVWVSGRVQGVWFRESTRRCAEALGVMGWVRNLPDGRVEAEFSGDAEAVRAALRFVEDGPELARVDDMEVEFRDETSVDDPERGFQIR